MLFSTEECDGCSDHFDLLWHFTFPCNQDCCCWYNSFILTCWNGFHLCHCGSHGLSSHVSFIYWVSRSIFACHDCNADILPWAGSAVWLVLIAWRSSRFLLSTPVLCWGMSLFFHEGVILWSLSVSLSLCYSEFLVGVWHMLSNVITHTEREMSEWWVQSSFHRVCAHSPEEGLVRIYI